MFVLNVILQRKKRKLSINITKLRNMNLYFQHKYTRYSFVMTIMHTERVEELSALANLVSGFHIYSIYDVEF